MSTQNATATPASVTSTGSGLSWANPGNATGTGIGTEIGTTVISFSITGNVVTFVTTPQNFVAGQGVTISGMFTGTYLNGQTLTVLASGLTTTGFTANFTHANVSSTYDSGFVTPTTLYTNTTNFSYVSLAPGQYALNVAPPDGPPGTAANGPHQVGPVLFLASSIFAQTKAIGGVNGYPIGPPSAGSASGPCPIPTLPAGSTVVGIHPYAIGTSSGSSVPAVFSASWTGGSTTFVLNGSPSVASSIGTNLSILSSLQFANNGGPSTLETQAPGYNYWDAISDYGAVIVYTTTGTPIPATQLQTLVATNLGLAIPTSANVVGVQVAFDAGIVVGSGVTSLQAQLTVAGTPVGSPKPISSLGGWSSAYALGSISDPWGAVLTGFEVNGSSGLGVNITGTLPSGNQINLNSLQVTVYYVIPAVVVNINVGNTRPPTVGRN